MIFDLDPSGKDFKPVIKAAKILKKTLENLKLNCFVMTTGSKGLHVVVPILREKDFSFTHKVSKQIATLAIEQAPDLLTLELSKAKRKKKIFIDYVRNSYGQTTIAPYSLRALSKAPIATPLYWEELDDKNFKSAQKYNLSNLEKKILKDKDPWKNINKKAKSLVKILKEMY